MNDKRSDSERVSARPALPSIAPPTDDIDAEWGVDELPAAARVPQLDAAPQPPAHATMPRPSASPAPPAAWSGAEASARRPASQPAPGPASVPRPGEPRASSAPSAADPAPRASSAPQAAAYNPLRKQTLLGLAPVMARPQPEAKEPAAVAAEGNATPRVEPGTNAQPRPAAESTALANPLRKKTLVGLAPVLHRSEPPPATSSQDASKASLAPTSLAPSSDAPTVADVTPARRAVVMESDDELPALRPRRPRWLVPLCVAAAIALGVVGLRRLDHLPPPAPPRAAVEPKAAVTPATQAAAVTPKVDSANSSAAREPEPAASTDARAADATATGTGAAAPRESGTAPVSADSAQSGGPTPSEDAAELLHISINSEPPGARLFWKGRPVGTTPFVLEFKAGERHAYELGLPGYTTRRVVIDGSKTELSIGLRPDPNAAIAATPRK